MSREGCRQGAAIDDALFSQLSSILVIEMSRSLRGLYVFWWRVCTMRSRASSGRARQHGYTCVDVNCCRMFATPPRRSGCLRWTSEWASARG